MKKALCLIILLVITSVSFAQTLAGEPVNWQNLKTFSASSFQFKSDQFDYNCTDCKFIEISSKSGISGYWLAGNATYAVPEKKLSGKANVILIRMSPENAKDYLKISGVSEFNDNAFFSVSLIALQSVFKRSYHSGMDALIPKAGEYTVNMFTENFQDLVVAFFDDKIELFDNTRKK